jgi:hypothetical protein
MSINGGATGLPEGTLNPLLARRDCATRDEAFSGERHSPEDTY